MCDPLLQKNYDEKLKISPLLCKIKTRRTRVEIESNK